MYKYTVNGSIDFGNGTQEPHCLHFSAYDIRTEHLTHITALPMRHLDITRHANCVYYNLVKMWNDISYLLFTIRGFNIFFK